MVATATGRQVCACFLFVAVCLCGCVAAFRCFHRVCACVSVLNSGARGRALSGRGAGPHHASRPRTRSGTGFDGDDDRNSYRSTLSLSSNPYKTDLLSEVMRSSIQGIEHPLTASSRMPAVGNSTTRVVSPEFRRAKQQVRDFRCLFAFWFSLGLLTTTGVHTFAAAKHCGSCRRTAGHADGFPNINDVTFCCRRPPAIARQIHVSGAVPVPHTK